MLSFSFSRRGPADQHVKSATRMHQERLRVGTAPQQENKTQIPLKKKAMARYLAYFPPSLVHFIPADSLAHNAVLRLLAKDVRRKSGEGDSVHDRGKKQKRTEVRIEGGSSAFTDCRSAFERMMRSLLFTSMGRGRNVGLVMAAINGREGFREWLGQKHGTRTAAAAAVAHKKNTTAAARIWLPPSTPYQFRNRTETQ